MIVISIIPMNINSKYWSPNPSNSFDYQLTQHPYYQHHDYNYKHKNLCQTKNKNEGGEANPLFAFVICTSTRLASTAVAFYLDKAKNSNKVYSYSLYSSYKKRFQHHQSKIRSANLSSGTYTAQFDGFSCKRYWHL